MRLLNSLILIGVILFQFNCKGQINKREFPIIIQETLMQCGPICIQMIGKYYGKDLDVKQLERVSKMDETGTSLFGLGEAANSVGLENISVKIPFTALVEDAPLPAIVHWNQNHFVVVYRATKRKIYVADPEKGKIEYTKKEFCENWIAPSDKSENEGLVMLLERTENFYKE